MTRKKLEHWVRDHGCIFLIEGREGTHYHHPATDSVAIIPREREIDDDVVKEICKTLGIDLPPSTVKSQSPAGKREPKIK